jgi:C4-type Zn-finger protein
MGQRMESGKAIRFGTAAEGGNGHAIRFFVASEQFSARSCARCDGLLVNEWCYDLPNTGEHSVETLRCVQCGHRVDPVILQNQIRPPIESQHVRSVRHKYSAKIVMLDEVA